MIVVRGFLLIEPCNQRQLIKQGNLLCLHTISNYINLVVRTTGIVAILL